MDNYIALWPGQHLFFCDKATISSLSANELDSLILKDGDLSEPLFKSCEESGRSPSQTSGSEEDYMISSLRARRTNFRIRSEFDMLLLPDCRGRIQFSFWAAPYLNAGIGDGTTYSFLQSWTSINYFSSAGLEGKQGSFTLLFKRAGWGAETWPSVSVFGESLALWAFSNPLGLFLNITRFTSMRAEYSFQYAGSW